jgi:hypothetical protein
MCLAVYTATDIPLKSIKWDEKKPAFYFEEISEAAIEVRRQFRYQHVYYTGSHEGCGCGFSKDGRDPDELQECQKNYDALGKLLSHHISNGAEVEIFTCWEGDQTVTPEITDTISINQLLQPQFELEQLSLLTVCKEA